LTSDWGYGTSYANPYYAEPVAAAAVPYDYSQPVVINNYVDANADAEGATATAQAVQDTPEAQKALSVFDEGLAAFKEGQYRPALGKFDLALRQRPGDAVVHEVRALTLFALADYKNCAAALNSFLSSAPGMDWTTLSSLYGNADDYQTQLRSLEKFCDDHPSDPAAHFVLAYHCLVLDAKDQAVAELRVVVKNQPKDVTAKRMLDALAPPDKPAVTAPAADEPQTDLTGNWRATARNVTIDLAVGDDSKFTWKAAQKGKPALELKGQLTATNDQIALESAKQGDMTGTVKSLGPDKWQFVLSGAPPSDPGLTFERVR
jgi:tetratricopeptide (TPR) repeat protein